MSHGIEVNDRGAVGYVERFGNTWHGIDSYVQMDGKVPMELAERIANYEVVKTPLYLFNGDKVKGANALIRKDTQEVLYPSVGEVYEVVQNYKLLDFVERDILDAYKGITIESVGTLFNGRRFFVNLLIDSYKVKGDVSETKNRLMLTNSFGGDALTSNLHDVRVVCNNTVMNAMAQGKANATLKKFRHTATAQNRLERHTVDLADIFAEKELQKQRFDHLASQPIATAQIDAFLESLFPTEGKAKRGLTIAQNRQEAVLEMYETKDDLKAIDHSKYRLFNAVTDWADHSMSVRKGDDLGKRYWNNLNGSSNDIKQKAFKLLMA